MDHTPRILLTGFEPFGGDLVNPSALVCRALHGQRVGHATVQAVELPCVFGRALQVLDEALAATSPVLVLALGLAAGRAEISVERVAINVDDARIPDNAGAQPVDLPVVADGPAAWFSTLPVKAMRIGISNGLWKPRKPVGGPTGAWVADRCRPGRLGTGICTVVLS